MDKRRATRGRPKRMENAKLPPIAVVTSTLTKRNAAAPASTIRKSPARRASPVGSHLSPVRRSSRSRSTVLGSSASTGTVPAPLTTKSSIKEKREEILHFSEEPQTQTTTLTTSAQGLTRAHITSSVHSSYSSTTQKTIDIRSYTAVADSEVAKLTDYMRRSVSKTSSISNSPDGEGDARGTPATTEISRDSRSVSQSVYNDDNYSKASEFSENEEGSDALDEHEFKSFSVTAGASRFQSCRKIDVPCEYGGWLGVALLMVLIPTVVYYLQWCCVASPSCKLMIPNLKGTLGLHYIALLFEPEALGSYLVFIMGVFVVSATLVGRRVRLPVERQSQQYYFNALPTAILLALLGGIGVAWFKYPLADFVLKHYLRFCIYGMINSFVVATWAFFRAKYIKEANVQPNIYGRSDSVLVNFALGCQINPKWFGLVEFKQVFYRLSLLTTLLFATCFVYKSLHIPTSRAVTTAAHVNLTEQPLLETIVNFSRFYYRNVQYEPTALLSSMLLLSYTLDAIVFEHHLASSFELQGEGFGALLLLRYAATPYVHSAVAKYFVERRVGAIAYRYGVYVAVTIFFFGLFLKRISSAIKYKYRIDPIHPYFRGIETIHTFQGRRLLLGSFWGRLRQPNYAGDIVALFGLALPLFLRFAWPPALNILLCISLLVHRSIRVNARNLSRYHSSWVRYCSRVRNYIFPKVF